MQTKTTKNLVVLVLLFSLGAPAAPASRPTFRLNLLSEPEGTSPLEQKSASAGYLFQQVHASLLPRVADCKTVTPTKISCKLQSQYRWSDGKAITAEQYKQTITEFLDPTKKALKPDLFFAIKNARSIYQGATQASQLGITAKGSSLIFNLEQPDSEFIYNLASPLVVPTRADKKENLYSGPYQIKSWTRGQKILLQPNIYFDPISAKLRPNLEFLILGEDSFSVQLYDKKQLDFVRRLPVSLIKKYRGTPDYLEVPLFRFDYIGFSSDLDTFPKFRQALAASLDYSQLQRIFDAPPRPGCIGIPEVLYLKKTCHDLDLKKAKELINQEKIPANLKFSFSRLGGESHKRALQWIQAQWRTGLGVKVELQELDNKLFLSQFQSLPSAIFRKGVVPDRPTCLAALESFKGSMGPDFDQNLNKMKTESNEKAKRKLCQKGLDALMTPAHIIPMGPMHFSMLMNPKWTGWKISELNVLDLTELHQQ